jgi:fructose/tagatose bisphosphate aldolase
MPALLGFVTGQENGSVSFSSSPNCSLCSVSEHHPQPSLHLSNRVILPAMNSYSTVSEMKEALSSAVRLEGDLQIVDRAALRDNCLDRLTATAVFAEDTGLRDAARWVIRSVAAACGIHSASIQDLYAARGRGECTGFTVPAINIRGLTYDVARAAFRAARRDDVGAVILEIARSEIGYTQQRPAEYTAVVTAAALREDWDGPVFLQGDHFQFNAAKFAADPEAEATAVLELTREAVNDGFLNIDIDTSTLVDLAHDSLDRQQRDNYERAAQCSRQIREIQPAGINVSIGGEIGEVGKKNSTPEELMAFMDGLARSLESQGIKGPGPSKISVQTGTSHGGVPMPDGSIAEVKLDFDTLGQLSRVARERYGMAGAVQHGASTLPEELFHRFPEVDTAEIHLATGFQNLIYSHPAFPTQLMDEIDEDLRRRHADERSDGQTDEQFLYKTRKKSFGPFKRTLWELGEDVRGPINASLEERFSFLFRKLAVPGTRELVAKHILPVSLPLPRPQSLA